MSIITTPIGDLSIVINKHKIVALQFLTPRDCQSKVDLDSSSICPRNLTLIKKATQQLNNYFYHNPQQKFALPLSFKNTCTILERTILNECKKIKPGTTKTYSEIAKKAGTSPRVVGNALRKNPFPIIIPCHRVVAKNGLGGYDGCRHGKMIKIKKWLLNWEKSF